MPLGKIVLRFSLDTWRLLFVCECKKSATSYAFSDALFLFFHFHWCAQVFWSDFQASVYCNARVSTRPIPNLLLTSRCRKIYFPRCPSRRVWRQEFTKIRAI